MNKKQNLIEPNEWEILKNVYEMLANGNVLNTQPTNEPIVRFQYPDKLQV